MRIQKKLFVGILLFVVTLGFAMPIEVVEAYTSGEINSNPTTKYAFTDASASAITMQISTGGKLTFKRNPRPTAPALGQQYGDYVYVLQGDHECKEGTPAGQLAKQTANIKIPTNQIDSNPNLANAKIDGKLTFFAQDGEGCTLKNVDSAIQITNTFGDSLAVPETEQAGADDGTNDLSCDAKLNSLLSWILCPVVELGASFVQFVFDSFVQPFLESVPISSNPEDGSYKAWQQFRLLGNIVLVGSMIAVVYAQIRGDR